MKVENVESAMIFSCYNECMGRMSEMIVRESVTRVHIITEWNTHIEGLIHLIYNNRIIILKNDNTYESINCESINEIFYVE